MNPQAAQNYLRTKVLTATPEQLQLMLYDGAISFALQGRAALDKKDYQASYKSLTKAQNILTELLSTLRPEVFPELCAKLAALYNYAYRNLVQANVHHKAEAVDEAVKVLRFQRETWAMLMEQLGKSKADKAPQLAAGPPQGRQLEATICLQG